MANCLLCQKFKQLNILGHVSVLCVCLNKTKTLLYGQSEIPKCCSRGQVRIIIQAKECLHILFPSLSASNLHWRRRRWWQTGYKWTLKLYSCTLCQRWWWLWQEERAQNPFILCQISVNSQVCCDRTKILTDTLTFISRSYIKASVSLLTHFMKHYTWDQY